MSRTFRRRSSSSRKASRSDFLHVLIAGSVELYASWNGRETSLSTVRPVSTFILAASIRDAPYLMSARTLEKSRIALIPSEDVRAVFDLDGDFARAIVTELAQCYRSVVKTTKDLKLRTSLERLANYLLREQKRADGATAFDLPMDKKRLASLLGMTAENLSRAFKNLQGYGVADRRRTGGDRRPDRPRTLRETGPPDRRSFQLMSDDVGASRRGTSDSRCSGAEVSATGQS